MTECLMRQEGSRDRVIGRIKRAIEYRRMAIRGIGIKNRFQIEDVLIEVEQILLRR